MEPIELPTAPRAARGIDINMDRVPTRAPFTAFIGNLPYEIEESEVAHFFKDLDIVGIRFPNERVKKYGYVEFADRQTLVTALGQDGEVRNEHMSGQNYGVWGGFIYDGINILMSGCMNFFFSV